MANQDQLSTRSKKVRAVPPLRKKTAEPRSPVGTFEIGAGVRMRCQELSADLAVIRFDCAAHAAQARAPLVSGNRRTRRPTGES